MPGCTMSLPLKKKTLSVDWMNQLTESVCSDLRIKLMGLAKLSSQLTNVTDIFEGLRKVLKTSENDLFYAFPPPRSFLRLSARWSAIMAMHSLFVGFPLIPLTV